MPRNRGSGDGMRMSFVLISLLFFGFDGMFGMVLELVFLFLMGFLLFLIFLLIFGEYLIFLVILFCSNRLAPAQARRKKIK